MKSVQTGWHGRKRTDRKGKVNMASQNVASRIRRMGRFFRKKSEANNDPHLVEVGDFRIDLDNRSVRIRDRELSLSPEEFDLLVFMAANPKRIITSHTKLSTRCGHHQVRQVEMLPTLLSLRKKLQTVADGSRYIRTEPWVCYRFEPEAI
jgi:two-component system, OmpR family, KDP operon response regulator KdpE